MSPARPPEARGRLLLGRPKYIYRNDEYNLIPAHQNLVHIPFVVYNRSLYKQQIHKKTVYLQTSATEFLMFSIYCWKISLASSGNPKSKVHRGRDSQHPTRPSSAPTRSTTPSGLPCAKPPPKTWAGVAGATGTAPRVPTVHLRRCTCRHETRQSGKVLVGVYETNCVLSDPNLLKKSRQVPARAALPNISSLLPIL